MGARQSAPAPAPEGASGPALPEDASVPPEANEAAAEVPIGTPMDLHAEPQSAAPLGKKDAIEACKVDHKALIDCYLDRSAFKLSPCQAEQMKFWRCLEEKMGREAKLPGSQSASAVLDSAKTRLKELGQTAEGVVGAVRASAADATRLAKEGAERAKGQFSNDDSSSKP
mmetsp:Transcript_6325/g.20496  ORF Transcript_6325/g.20496 Transcript_6325/m.20496 type:complete len:170 (-) Transcript_6325:208-717(-)